MVLDTKTAYGHDLLALKPRRRIKTARSDDVMGNGRGPVGGVAQNSERRATLSAGIYVKYYMVELD